jgi:hypothetical protein
MPAVLAGAGTSSLLTLGVIALGATLLAIMFGQLTKRVPTPTAGCTHTPATSSVTSPVTSPGGATGSSAGRATPPSSRPGSSTSTPYSAGARRASGTGASPSLACGCRLW